MKKMNALDMPGIVLNVAAGITAGSLALMALDLASEMWLDLANKTCH